ncbi:MAG TPA: tetratricopeptide repeat protein, partial [Pirellulales bacterium]|nr:tetratricopeptide repeat protein [Pirellulales bacterium]
MRPLPCACLRWAYLPCVCLLGLTLGAARADVVELLSPSNPRARSRITGKVLEYTGREIVIQVHGGREFKRPGALVVAIETDWPAGIAEGDARFAAGDFKLARDQYSTAIREEKRTWARRKILAKIIACYKAQGQFEQAGRLFLGLVREDPDSPDFALIPLAWLPAEPPPGLAQTAEQWLEDLETPAALLLGASHLLPTARRATALERLALLGKDKDRRIDALTQAQTWRTQLAAANDGQVERWQRAIQEFPEALRAGPYFVLGQALARRDKASEAVLALLHVPILYPQERQLASESLLAAAQLLEKRAQHAAAAQLYQELLSGYPNTRAAAEAVSHSERPGATGAATVVVAAAGDSAAAAADTMEQRFLDGLRGRRLYELAEAYCRGESADTGLFARRRAELAVELSRTFADHALQVVPDEREALWTQALAAVDDLMRQEPNHPRRVLLEAQRGLVQLARGELARQEAEILGGSQQRFERAREELRAAVAALQTARETLTAELRRANLSKRSDPERPSGDELASLERNLNYQLARAFRNQGQSYPAGSEDRTNSLGQAIERLKPLAEGDYDDEVVWLGRLDEIVCERLLEDYPAAARRLALLDQREPPPGIEASARAEEIRLALGRGQLREALALLEAGRMVAGQPSADLDYAFLETYAASWRAAGKAGDVEGAARLQAQAADLIQDIDRLYGPYWSRRAETLLAGSVSSASGPKDAKLLIRAAESLFRAGQFEQAVAAYDQAAEQAAQTKQDDLAFDAGYTAAVVEQEQGRRRKAAERFRRLALSLPKHAKAGDAHLLAIYNTAQAAKTDPAAAADEYPALLQEHLQHFSRATSANQARLWLGKLRERQRDYSAAIAAYRDISADDPRYLEAVEGMARSHKNRLAELSAAGEPTREAAQQAARYFEQLVLGDRNKLP